MTRRFYANAAPQVTLASSITSGATSLTISGTFAGWPVSFPYFAALDYGTASMELVLVTNVVGSVATITRAQDGTAAISHAAGATLDQVFVRQDLDEANAHVNATSGAHGISGSFVGTSDSQTLTNKTLTNPTVNGANVSGTWAGTLAASGLTLTSPIINTPNANAGTWANGVNTGDATHAALVGKATTAGGKTLSLTNSSSVEKLSVDDAGKLTAFTVTAGLVPSTFTTEASATVSLPSPTAETIVWLTAPTGGGPAGPYYWTGSAWAMVTPGFLYGDNADVTGITLSTTAAFAGSAKVTFTLPVQRRVRVLTIARYTIATVTGGRLQVIPAYNTGASPVIGSAVSLTNGQYHLTNFTGAAGSAGVTSGMTEATVLLAAGQYTAYAAVARVSGGSATDVASAFYTAVYDAGAV